MLSGSMEANDNRIDILADGGSNKIMHTNHFSGDTMVMSMQEGIQVFHLVKKYTVQNFKQD